MRRNPIPKRGEPGITFDTWRNTVYQVKKTMGLNLDPSIFLTQNDPTGTFITLIPSYVSSFPWDKLLFGYSIDGNIFTVLAGEVHFRDIIYDCAETDLTIADDLTYIYLEMEWGTGLCTIKQTTDRTTATTSSQCYRKWLYLLNYTAPSDVSVKTYGWIGGALDIMPVFG